MNYSGQNVNHSRANSSKSNSTNVSNTNQNDSQQKLQKLPFRITAVSSQEEGYPVTELLNHTPFSRGWQSARFCEYPQEIIIEFQSVLRVRQIQYLSHQYKISSKIEILISNGEKFKKIGFFPLPVQPRHTRALCNNFQNIFFSNTSSYTTKRDLNI
jgi:hypothetical protein